MGKGKRERRAHAAAATNIDTDIDTLTSTIREVQRATLVKEVPRGSWMCELKWDGYRILAHKGGADVRLMSRQHHDWTAEFSVIADAVRDLSTRECVLDGEVCAIAPDGTPSFQRLQNRARRSANLVFFVFDLLWHDGEDLRGRPLEERRTRLETVCPNADSLGVVRISTAVDGEPQQILSAACKAGLEGIVVKRKGSLYNGTRDGTWLKVKCTLRQEFAVVGYLPLKKTQRAVGGLLLALRGERDEPLHYVGKVGTGFDEKTRASLAILLDANRSPSPTVLRAPHFDGIARWSEPKYVAEVEFTECTEAGDVRHPSFRGLREDKKPEDCVRERPVSIEEPQWSAPPDAAEDHPKLNARRFKKKTASARRPDERIAVGGISISHPGRVLEPTGITKLDLARYYEAIGERMLPHVKGRPLTLLLYDPKSDSEKGGTFMRHARAWGPDVLRRVRIQEKTKVGEYLVVDDVAGLVALAQMDVLEIHTWNSVADDVEHPNRVVFDLDPAPDVPWTRVVECAHDVRLRLKALKLASWPKTTGGKGLHVVVPLKPVANWDECFAFAKAFAAEMVRDRPKDYVSTLSKEKRKGKILIDYLRNNRTNTSVAAFSIRARPAGPVSMPVTWDEVEPSLRNRAFNPRSVVRRVSESRDDPWAGYWRRNQSLPRESLRGTLGFSR